MECQLRISQTPVSTSHWYTPPQPTDKGTEAQGGRKVTTGPGSSRDLPEDTRAQLRPPFPWATFLILGSIWQQRPP